MTPEEKSLIEDLFARIRGNGVPNRDPEADSLIGRQMTGTPGAAYALVQTVIVQDHALQAANARIQALEAAQGQAAPLQNSSFLPPAQPSQASHWLRPSVPQAGPWDGPAHAQPAPPRGGSFLQGALQTAAGVAGGALLFDGIRSLFGGGFGPFGGGMFGGGPWGGQPNVVDETIVNNYDVLPDAGGGIPQQDQFQPDPQVTDADWTNDSGTGDGGVDPGSIDDNSGSGWA